MMQFQMCKYWDLNNVCSIQKAETKETPKCAFFCSHLTGFGALLAVLNYDKNVSLM